MMICVDIEISFPREYGIGCDRWDDEVCFYLGPMMICFEKRVVKAAEIKPQICKYIPQGEDRQYYGWGICSFSWLGSYLEMSMPLR